MEAVLQAILKKGAEMPNVEIHGMYMDGATTLRKRIFEVLPNDDLVVTVIKSDVNDREGNVQPFLRLVNTCQDGTPLIIERLLTLGMDVEHLALNGFYPAT